MYTEDWEQMDSGILTRFSETALFKLIVRILIITQLTFALGIPSAQAANSFPGSVVAQSVADLTVSEYKLVSSVRVTRTLFDFTYTAKITNLGNTTFSGGTATVTSKAAATSIIDSQITFGKVPTGASAVSQDTFTIRQDRTLSFNPADLVWSVQATPENKAPVANAGNDQHIAVGATVQLDGSTSTDANGDSLTYAWQLISKPVGSFVQLQDDTSIHPSFVADRPGNYIVRLVVNDGQLLSIADDVTISTVNTKPIANAGSDQTVPVNGLAQLDGSASSDNDGDPLSYQWSIVSKPVGSNTSLSAVSIANPTLAIDKPGNYVLQLVVNDGDLSSSADQIIINTRNTIPVANAGLDRQIQLGQTVILDGSGSTDVDGDNLIYKWSLTTIPAGSTASLSDIAAVKPTILADKSGTYVAQLIVNDGTSDSLADTVTFTTENNKPIADAGADKSVPVPSKVALNGNASRDPDNNALTYLWSMVSKPQGSLASLDNPTIAQPQIIIDLPGRYVVQLVVNDGQINSDPDTLVISTENLKPVANAGSDQNLKKGNVVQLNGSLSTDADGNPLTYQWSFSSRPASSNAVLSDVTAQKPTYTADVAGIFVLQLITNDGTVNSDPDTAVITVEEETVIVPNLVGQQQAAALVSLTAANLTMGTLTPQNSDTIPVGQVIQQSPVAGSSAIKGSAVNLTISSGPVKVTVPNVVGQSQNVAQLAITTANLVLGSSSQQNSDNVPLGSVISQNPLAGTLVSKGSSVNLVISSGPAKVLVPNVTGQTQSLALQAITSANLVVGTTSQQSSDTVSLGSVISQNPLAGAQVNKGSAVNLVLSSGPAQVSVPNVTGQAQNTAQTTITTANLTLGSTTQQSSDAVPSGNVISQNPLAGVLVNKGSPVNLVISSGPDNALPYAELQLSVAPDVVSIGDTVWITATVTGGNGIPATKLTIDGIAQPLDANGQAQVVATTPGVHHVIASIPTATGTLSKESQYTVRNATDITVPTAIITAPVQDALISAPINITGTAADTNFAYYQLLIRPAGGSDTSWRELSKSYNQVANGTLGSLDSAVLANGLYELALKVTDVNGQSSTAAVGIEILGDLKLGPFRIAFEDLNIDASGIPVRVTRSYDSLIRSQSKDFGWGWTVDYQNLSLRKNMALGAAWAVTKQGFFNLCLRPVGSRKISVTLPDGKVERFTASNQQDCAFAQVPELNIQFTAQPGTTSTLALTDSGYAGYVYVGGNRLIDPDTGDDWNPTRFILTTEDGYSYYLQEGVGIESVKDPFGNTLTYSQNGIVHSAGLSVNFIRDAQGRITNITDPQGKSIQYKYNARGELISKTDREGQVASFNYALGHLLVDYTDPRGIKVAKQIYDDNGRLVAQIDADGNRTELGYDEANNRQTVTDRLGNKTTYVYDNQGNITEIIDALGKSTRYSYDALGNETQVVDSLGNAINKTFDAQTGMILSEKDPLGNTTAYSYDSTNKTQLKSVTNPLNATTNYGFFRGLPNSIQEPLGRSTSIGYDATGNFISLNVAGQKDSFVYNSKGQRISQTDAAGLTTKYTLDGNGRETGSSWDRTDAGGNKQTIQTYRTLDGEGRALTETDPTGAVSKYQYNGADKVTQEIDPLGRITKYDYDAHARLIKTTYPDASFIATGYDANGNVISETDRAGRVSLKTYDALNRLVKTTNPDGTSASNVYDDAGRVSKTIDELGQATVNNYDAAGRLIAVTSPDNKTTRYEYDANGNRTKVINPDNQSTVYTYDALNRLTKTTFPDNTAISTVWRADGRKQSETDQTNISRDFGYDAAGRLSQVKELSGTEVTIYDYDEAGNKIRQTDAEGRITRWDYDAANRLSARTLPDGSKETYQYDQAGRLVAHTGFDGLSLVYSYDNNDNRIQTKYPDGKTLQWTYAADGLITSSTDALGTTQYQYDSQGRTSKQTQPDGSILAWAYDAAGNITERSTPSGKTKYGYDNQGRINKVIDPQGNITSYTYDNAGRLQNQTNANSTQASYSYDVNGRLTQLLHTKTSGALLSGVAYTLAADGQRTEVREYDNQSTLSNGLAQNPLRTARYSYDASNRLLREVVTDRTQANLRTVDYAYDKVGNRVQKILVTPSSTETTTYVYDTDDRLISEAKTTNGNTQATIYTWDANGRLAKKAEANQITLYGWDSEDHLIEVKRGATEATAQIVASYAYDSQGNRIEKLEKTAQGNRTTQYLVDTSFPYAQVVEEKTTLGAQSQTARYVWGEGLIARVVGSQESYYHADGLGSVKALSNSTGSLTDTYEYEAFGQVLGHTGANTQAYRFAGEYFDPEVGMQYHRARWYDPGTGRFTALDQYVGNLNRPSTLHKYSYVGSNPVNDIDPSGYMSLGSVSIGLNVSSILSTASIQGANFAVRRFLFNAGGNGLGLVGELIKRLAIEAAQDLLLDSAFDQLDKQGRGTRGHAYFEKRVKELNDRIRKFKPLKGVEIRSEVFVDSAGASVGRRAKDSLGIDVLVLYENKRVLAFDLKFGRKMGNTRAKQLKSRLDMNVYDVGIFELTVKLKKV